MSRDDMNESPSQSGRVLQRSGASALIPPLSPCCSVPVYLLPYPHPHPHHRNLPHPLSLSGSRHCRTSYSLFSSSSCLSSSFTCCSIQPAIITSVSRRRVGGARGEREETDRQQRERSGGQEQMERGSEGGVREGRRERERVRATRNAVLQGESK